MSRYKLGPDYINPYDWKKSSKRGWQYKYDAPWDKDWIADRKKIFAESGNGWWRLKGTPDYRKHMNRIRRDNEEKNIREEQELHARFQIKTKTRAKIIRSSTSIKR